MWMPPEAPDTPPARRGHAPGGIAWTVAFISLILPWAGLIAGIVGVGLVGRGASGGWWLIGLGLALVAIDLAIDLWWAHPSVTRSDEPALNRRARQVVGRTAVVAEPFLGRRGKVRIDGTLWQAEGEVGPVGSKVRVTGLAAGARDVLEVEGLVPLTRP
jgi:hypothetical protein